MLKQGYTLIELIVAFAIFGMLATGVTLALTAVLRSTARTAIQAKVRNEGEYLLETISQRVRYSQSTVCSGTALIYTPTNTSLPVGQVDCVGPDANGDYHIDSGGVMDSSEVKITDCSFTCSSPVKDVEIRFTIQDKNGIVSPVYYDTNIVLRNAK